MNSFNNNKKHRIEQLSLPSDIYKKVRSYAAPAISCQELSNKYTECSPPFKYIDTLSGERQNCCKDCWRNLHVWLPLLLAEIPDVLWFDIRDERKAISANRTKHAGWSYNVDGDTLSLFPSKEKKTDWTRTLEKGIETIIIYLPFELDRRQQSVVVNLAGTDSRREAWSAHMRPHFVGRNAARWNRIQHINVQLPTASSDHAIYARIYC